MSKSCKIVMWVVFSIAIIMVASLFYFMFVHHGLCMNRGCGVGSHMGGSQMGGSCH